MFRILRLLLLLFLAPSFALAACVPPFEPPTSAAMQAALAGARDRGFLWRISKDGRTSHLYGTIHVGKLEWIFPGPRVQQALSNADTVALELDPLDPEIQRRMSEAATKLRGEVLPPRLAARLQREMSARCVAPGAIGSATPELQMVMLSLAVAREAGLESSYAIDIALAAWGHRERKQMVSLETPEGQLAVLQMRSATETVEFVETGLADLGAGRSAKKVETLSRVWAESDAAAMERFEAWCDCLSTDLERKLMRRMLDGRNPALAERIDALHQSGKRVFAAVGSLHLFGPVGLPTLLAQRGYRVERVDFAPSSPGSGRTANQPSDPR